MNTRLLEIGMNSFLLGGLSMGFLAIAMFFARFFARTRDRFFAIMAVAFVIMSINQLFLLVWGEDSEFHSWLYVIRLAAFVLILIAILDKNRA
jgi:uncharacterized membrane protein